MPDPGVNNANPPSPGSWSSFGWGLRSSVNFFGSLDWAQGHVESWWNGKSAEQNIKDIKAADGAARKLHPTAYWSGLGTGFVATFFIPGGGEATGAKLIAEGADALDGAKAVDAITETAGAASRFGAKASEEKVLDGGVEIFNRKTGLWEAVEPAGSSSRALVHVGPSRVPAMVETAEGEAGTALARRPPSALVESAETDAETGNTGTALARTDTEAGSTESSLSKVTPARRGVPLGTIAKTAIRGNIILNAGGVAAGMLAGSAADAQTPGQPTQGSDHSSTGNTGTSTAPSNVPTKPSGRFFPINLYGDGAPVGGIFSRSSNPYGNGSRTEGNLLSRLSTVTKREGFGEAVTFDVDNHGGQNDPNHLSKVTVNTADGTTIIVENGRIETQKGGASSVITRDPHTGVWHDRGGATVPFTNPALSAGTDIFKEVLLTHPSAGPAVNPAPNPAPNPTPNPAPSAPVKPSGERPRNVINFAFDSYRVDPAAQAEIKAEANYLNTNHVTSVRVDGYTDEVGTDAYNQHLSEERADATAQALKTAGYTGTVTTEGHGKHDPVVDTPKANAQNRRAVISTVSAP